MEKVELSKLNNLIERLIEIQNEISEDGGDKDCDVVVTTQFGNRIRHCKIVLVCRDVNKNNNKVCIDVEWV